ncbi:conserved hypothetical protein [Paenibacillus curdlanolyticus YK9]|uniref:Uncharacterized protein n=1 Tax=Paenibacillus curdlanolyticus YK9 TaxID=717606 RepID=E0IFC7_9BACL|nr:DUF2019 domain-containing protein [Paenibacillus curdlanolyticus]EFM08903.1 conserved hypothetical protein [Paenibacillus curdlanolyticus YK9]
MEKLNDLINKYIESTIKHGVESESGNYKEANKHYKNKTNYFIEIKSLGENGQEEMLNLLKHENGHVRVGAAFHVLSFHPELGEKKLVESVNEPDGVGFKAKLILSEWREGNLN